MCEKVSVSAKDSATEEMVVSSGGSSSPGPEYCRSGVQRQRPLSARSAEIFSNILSYFSSALKQSDNNPELSSQQEALSVSGLKKDGKYSSQWLKMSECDGEDMKIK